MSNSPLKKTNSMLEKNLVQTLKKSQTLQDKEKEKEAKKRLQEEL